CYGYTITSQDSTGNPSNVIINTPTALSDTGAGQFYSDSGCGTLITQVTIPINTNNVTVYFKDNTAQPTTLTANASGLALGNLSVTVQGGSPSKFQITGTSSLTAASCALYTVTSQDVAGNTVNELVNTTVNLSNSGAGSFFSDSGCTV